jgi:hypothetical protein
MGKKLAVRHLDRPFELALTKEEMHDLIEYLTSI